MTMNLKKALFLASAAFGMIGAGLATASWAEEASQSQIIADKSAVGELAYWNTIKDSTSPQDFRTYLENFPDGMFADPAMERFEKNGGQRGELPPTLLASINQEAATTAAPETDVDPALKLGDVPESNVVPVEKPKKKATAKPVKKKATAKAKAKPSAKSTAKAKTKTKKKPATAAKAKPKKPQCANGAPADNCVVASTTPPKKKKPTVLQKLRPGSGGSGGGGTTSGGGGWNGG